MVDLKLVHEYTKELHILYVEDNETLRESTLKVLNNFFQAVDIAVDGRDGIEKYKSFQQSHERCYDLVISDINMPHLNGLEMSEVLLKLEPTQSIIFITAHNEVEFLHQAISLGISSFLLKPLNLQDLASVLFKVCQSISDRKIVLEHYAMIEEMNQQLENQNEALEEKNREQERLLRILDTMELKAHRQAPLTESTVEEDAQSSEEASYYEQINQLREEDLPELREIHEELDATIITVLSGRYEQISQMPLLFSRYASILGMYSSFDVLSSTMIKFVKAVEASPLPQNEENTDEIFMFLEAFMYILGKWQKDLLEENGEKLKRLDVSIIGDIETITNMWLAKKESEASFEVEFF